ncbi:hypothetical protein [Rhizobium sp. HT1-10]|uniref:hypothetical protein n=1 Tax=Rhizobium sp. HT1-10 TaxID=3111638 RepID=UPI003C16C4D3
MSYIPGFEPADFGNTLDGLTNRAGNPTFTKATLIWSKPQILDKDTHRPFFEDNRPLLYVIIRNHHSMKKKDRICYIGLSTTPKNRFKNHPKARTLSQMRGETSLSYAYLDEENSKNVARVKPALEQIEHILIWTLWQQLENDRKLFVLPGMGAFAGQAWHIVNEGYRFAGQMPKEIVYPWMLVRKGRDRSNK